MSARTAEVRRRRTTNMVAALIMGAAIRPRVIFVKLCDGHSGCAPCGAPRNDVPVSDHRIPRRGHHAVAGAVLLDMAEARERIMEALHRELLGHHHVVDPAAGLFRDVTVLVEE